MNKNGILRVYGQGGVEVEIVRNYLADFEYAYNSILAFEAAIEAIQRASHLFPFPSFLIWFPYGPTFKVPRAIRFLRDWPPSPKEIASLVPNRDRLVITGVSLQSPGFWEFLGNLNPLEVIRQYINDRHERRKDKDYRESSEARRLELENLKLENEVLRERIKIAKELGATDQDLAPLLNELVFRSLRALDHHQDRGVIERAEISNQKP